MYVHIHIYFALLCSSFVIREYKVCKKCNCLLSRAHTQLRMFIVRKRARINKIVTYNVRWKCV